MKRKVSNAFNLVKAVLRHHTSHLQVLLEILTGANSNSWLPIVPISH